MNKPIINLADAPVYSGSSGDWFQYSLHALAAPLGARTIGANVTRVPPGKAAFPLHHHHANEEHFFILSGTGVRIAAAMEPGAGRHGTGCCPSCSASSSVNSRDRVRKRRPVGPSSENMPPRPGTTSMVRCVCCQYSNCARLM